jgi:O-antigen/teichoic acid export membrane protein
VLILNGTSTLLGFAAVLLLSRMLHTRGYGLYAYAMAWVGFLGVPAVLGLDRYLVRGASAYSELGEWGLLRGLLQRSSVWVASVSLLIAAGAVAVAVATLHGGWRWGFSTAMVLVPLTALTLIRQAVLQAFGQPTLSQLPELAVRPVLLVGGLLALWTSVRAPSPTEALLIAVGASLAAFAVGAWSVRRVLPGQVRTATVRYETRQWILAAFPMMLLGAVWLVNSYASTILLGVLRDPTQVGVFSVCSKASALVSLPLTAAIIPLAPEIARRHAAGDTAGLEAVVVRAARLAAVVALPVAVGLLLLKDVLFHALGSGFSAGGTTLIVLVAGQWLNTLTGPVAMILMMTGLERRATRAMAIGFGLLIILDLVLIPSLGSLGCAIATTASVVVWNLVMVGEGERRLGIATTALGTRLFRRLSSHAGTAGDDGQR